MILVYITAESVEEAKKIASHLIEKKLAACANIFPIVSMFVWENKISENQESVLIVKTKENLYDEIKTEVEKIHSYDVPCILKIKAEGNEKYINWMDGVLK